MHRTLCLSFAFLAISACAAAPATAQTMSVFSEGFEGLSLGPYVSPTEGGGDGTDFTQTTPGGWTLDNSGMSALGNPVEFQGWTFHEFGSWVSTAGNQDRSQFGRASGAVMIADGDEYDDGTGVEPGGFNSYITTRPVSTAHWNDNTAQLTLDSSFRPYDGQTGTIEVSFDGGNNFTNLETLTTANSGGNSSLSRVNEGLSYNLNNSGGGDMVLRFGYTNAGNDWWWSVDNIQVTADVNAPGPQTQLFSEDFEGLALGPFVSGTEGGGDGTDFTSTPPAGWTRTNSSPAGENSPIGNPVEFQGWSFMDKNSWIATEGNQDRVDFTLGSGTVMVADPDAYDDGTNVDPDLFNTIMTTPSIDLTNIEENSVVLEFDSSFRPFDDMTGIVDVSYDDGATWENILTLVNGDDVTQRNEHLEFLLDNPAGGTLTARFGSLNGGNDWWWAVDNISISGVQTAAAVPEPASMAMWALMALVGTAFACGRFRNAPAGSVLGRR